MGRGTLPLCKFISAQKAPHEARPKLLNNWRFGELPPPLKTPKNRHFAKRTESYLFHEGCRATGDSSKENHKHNQGPNKQRCVMWGLLGLSISNLLRGDFSEHRCLYTGKKSDDGRVFSFSEKCKMMILWLQVEGRQIQPWNKMQRWLNARTA